MTWVTCPRCKSKDENLEIKRCFNHEDVCIDNPVFIRNIRKLNGL